MPRVAPMTRFAISNATARRTLAGLWLFFFMLNLSVICYLYLSNWIEEDNFWAAVSEVNSLMLSILAPLLHSFLWIVKREI